MSPVAQCWVVEGEWELDGGAWSYTAAVVPAWALSLETRPPSKFQFRDTPLNEKKHTILCNNVYVVHSLIIVIVEYN